MNPGSNGCERVLLGTVNKSIIVFTMPQPRKLASRSKNTSIDPDGLKIIGSSFQNKSKEINAGLSIADDENRSIEVNDEYLLEERFYSNRLNILADKTADLLMRDSMTSHVCRRNNHNRLIQSRGDINRISSKELPQSLEGLIPNLPIADMLAILRAQEVLLD